MNSPATCITPPYGRRLLVHLVEERAQTHYPRPYASIPCDPSDASAGYRDVSYWEFNNAINRCAQWIWSQSELRSVSMPLVYAGPNDLRYQILAQAVAKTGHTVFFVSPRNSIEVHLALLEEAKTAKFIVPSDGEPPFVTQLVQHTPIERYTLPGLVELLDASPVPRVPCHKTWEQLRMEPWVMLHTSGSTGTPKIITLRHGYATTIDAFGLQPYNETAARVGNCRLFAPFPAFHVAGIIYSMMVSPFVDSTIVFPPTAPLTAAVINSVHIYGAVEHSSIPPSLIVESTRNTAFLETLNRLKGLTYAGGPLAKPVGDMLCQQMPLYTTLGATETASLPMHPKDREDWAYFNFNTELGGMEFWDTGTDGLYEMVVVRDPRLALFQAVFLTFPDISEYHTKDLFSRHPTKPGLWRYEGRLDDVLVLSNGEKINPVTMEGIITSCDKVAGCVVFGQGKFQTGLLVQPVTPPTTHEETDAFVQEIWPHVERANQGCVKHGRIVRDLIILTDQGRPLPRAPKGTIQRMKANALYEDEITQGYQQLDGNNLGSNQDIQLNLLSTEDSINTLVRYMSQQMGNPSLGGADDIFKSGVDSLEVMSLVRLLQTAVHTTRPIEAKDIYDHPTIAGLVAYLQNMEHLDRRDSEDVDRETWNAMEGSFQRALRRLPDYRNESTGPFRYWKLTSDRWIIPPDGGTTAWLQVLASFLINLNNWGLANSFGAFQAFFEAELLASHSPASIAWIGTLQAALILIVGVVSGPLFDKGYFLPVLITASSLLVLSLVLLSFATEYYQVMLTWGVLGGLCSGFLYIPSIAMIPLFFTSHRGLAIGLATAGAPVGGVIYPILVRRLLNTAGFGWACRAIALIALLTLAAAILLFKPVGQRGKRPVRHLFDTSMFADLPFAANMVAAFFMYAGFLVPFILTPVFAQRGLDTATDEDTSFYLLAVPNAAQFFGRVLPAFLSDSKAVGPELLLCCAAFLAALLSLCWIAVHNLGGFMVYLVLYGFASGAIATLPPAVLPYITPSLSTIGTRIGMVYACAGIGALIGTPIALAADDSNGGARGFLGAQLWSGLTMLAGAMTFMITAYEARKRRIIIDGGSRKSKQKGLEEYRNSAMEMG